MAESRSVPPAFVLPQAPPSSEIKPLTPHVVMAPPYQPKSPVPAVQKAIAAEPRRDQSRVSLETQIDLSSDSNFFTGFSSNLSEGGIFVATVQPLAHGTPVDLSFSLPTGKKIQVKGVVRWTRESNDKAPNIFPGIGIKFNELHPDTTHAIREFVASREPMFFPD